MLAMASVHPRPRKGVLIQKLQQRSKVYQPAKAKTILCPHCGKYLAKKTLNRHRKLFYNEESGVWRKGLSKSMGKCKVIGRTLITCLHH